MLYHWWLKEQESKGWATAKNVFNDTEIHQIKLIGKNPELSTIEEPLIASGLSDKNYRHCKTSFIRADLQETQWIFRRLTDVILEINLRFFQFDLDYLQSLQFTEYFQGGQYKQHTDIESSSERTRKLSFSLQLDLPDSYHGGNLEIFYNENPFIAEKEKGSLTAFPSYALHSVSPVESGVRHSLVGWVCGPKFK